jgi:hypothetical protein
MKNEKKMKMEGNENEKSKLTRKMKNNSKTSGNKNSTKNQSYIRIYDKKEVDHENYFRKLILEIINSVLKIQN